MSGKLYIVPTPIGNLQDITLRALDVLKEVDTILAEDTRQTQKLLSHFGIQKQMYSHHKFNEHKTSEIIIQKLQGGVSMALVSDGGTPGISDPGFFLVRACIEANVPVETLPGAVAFVPALINSGLPADRFVFEGFLPQKKGRKTRLEALKEETRTIIFYESPHRIVKALTQFAEVFGSERRASVSREITKKFEETRRGTLAELIAYFTKNAPKGEFVAVIEGKQKASKNQEED
jgi:16S rRNA (cytidine1402-2'-O)-methyltransferase